MRSALPIGLAMMLAACPLAGAGLPEGAIVLPGSTVPTMLQQCSRQTPEAGESTWRPGGSEIAALEAALPAAIGAQPPAMDREALARAPTGWQRQYVGIARGGRRFLYGNFFPAEVASHGDDPNRWRREPIVICDGGPVFFGVEYDVEAGRFTQLAYNGGIG